MANIIESTLIYNANLSAAMSQVKTLTGEIGALTTSMNAADAAALRMRSSMAAAFAANIGAMGGFRATMTNMSTAAESFGKRLAANKLTMREYFAEAARGITKQDSLMRQFARNQARYMESMAIPMGRTAGGRPTGMVLTPSTIDLKNMQTRMNLANQQFNTFRHLVNSGAQEMINFGKNTQWTGRQLTVGLTMPVLLFGAAFAKTFMNIDKELTRFGKVYGNDIVNTTVGATEKMKNSVVDLAKTISSQYGVAMKETVALAADVAATGQEGQKLLDTVAQTSRLAVLGEVDRQEAMKATLAIQTAFKQNTNELAESINFLNAIENQTSTTLNDLVEAIPKAGPVVKGLGGSIKDLSVLMVAMKEGGIPAAEAANAIKSGMASLINPTQKASEVAKQFGVDLQGIVTSNKGQLMPTLFAVQKSLDGLDSFAKSRIIEEVFGKYQFARISALFNNLGKAGSQTEQAMKLAGASTSELAGIAAKELKTYTESTTVRFMRMVETIKNQLLPLGESLLKTLTPALEGLSKVISGISSFLDKVPEPMKNFLGIVSGFALVAGPALMLIGLFKQLIGNGIKAAMAVAGLGARLMGIKTGKLEVLDEEAMAAKLGIDRLTVAFQSQEVALTGLNAEMQIYLAALKQAQMTNPAMFRPPLGSPLPLRRQKGGPIPGYGGGDIVPAVLEPGEFVVTKEATKNNRSFLEKINGGQSVGRFASGTPATSAAGSGQGVQNRPSRLHTQSPETFRNDILRALTILADPRKVGLAGRSLLPNIPPDVARRLLGDILIESGRGPQHAVALGYGKLTSTIYPQSLNNAFEKISRSTVGYKSWMGDGIPFDGQSAKQMRDVLDRHILANPNSKIKDFRAAQAILDDLIEKERIDPGYIRKNTLMGYAATTAAADRMTYGASETAERKKAQRLYEKLNRETFGMDASAAKRYVKSESLGLALRELAYGRTRSRGDFLGTLAMRIYSGKTSSKAKDYAKTLSNLAHPYAKPSEVARNYQLYGATPRRIGPAAIAATATLGLLTLLGGASMLQGYNNSNSAAGTGSGTGPFGFLKGILGFQKGGSAPGSPALLEPGEYVINSNAAAKYRPILEGMNDGTIRGFQEGTPKGMHKTHFASPSISVMGSQVLAMGPQSGIARQIAADQTYKLYNNLVLLLRAEYNEKLRTGQMDKKLFIEKMKTEQAWSIITKNTTLTFAELQPVIQRMEANLAALGTEIIGDTQLYQASDAAIRDLALSGDKAARTLQLLGSQYGTIGLGEKNQRQRLGAQVAPSYTRFGDAKIDTIGPTIIPPAGVIAAARTPLQYQAGMATGLQQLQQKQAAVTMAMQTRSAQMTALQAQLAREQATLQATAGFAPGSVAGRAAANIQNQKKAQIARIEQQLAALKEQELKDEKYLAGLRVSETKLQQRKLQLEAEIKKFTEVERQQAAAAAATPNQGGTGAAGGGRGTGMGMQGLFAISMLLPMMSSFGDQTSEATQNMQKFSMALMAATTLMMFMPSGGMTRMGRAFGREGALGQLGARGAAPIQSYISGTRAGETAMGRYMANAGSGTAAFFGRQATKLDESAKKLSDKAGTIRSAADKVSTETSKSAQAAMRRAEVASSRMTRIQESVSRRLSGIMTPQVPTQRYGMVPFTPATTAAQFDERSRAQGLTRAAIPITNESMFRRLTRSSVEGYRSYVGRGPEYAPGRVPMDRSVTGTMFRGLVTNIDRGLRPEAFLSRGEARAAAIAEREQARLQAQAARAESAAARRTGLGTSIVKGGAAFASAGGRVGAAAAGGALRGLGAVSGALLGIGGIAGGVLVALAAVGVGIYQYNKSLEEARKRAISAFADPVKTVEYFGKTMKSVKDQVIEATMAIGAGKDNLQEVDQSLRDAVKQDYAYLIQRIQGAPAEAGARQLAIAFNKMLASGLSADEAKASIQAIAMEAGTQGGLAYGAAMKQGMLKEMTPKEMIDQTIKLFDPTQDANVKLKTDLDAQRRELEARKKELLTTKNVGSITGIDDETVKRTYGLSSGIMGSISSILALSGNLPPVLQWFASDKTKELNSINDALENTNAEIQSLEDIDSAQLIGFTEQMFEFFKLDPTNTIAAFDQIATTARDITTIEFDSTPIQKYLTELDAFAGASLARMIAAAGDQAETLSQAIMKAIAAGITPQEINNILKTQGLMALEAEINLNVKIRELEIDVEEIKKSIQDFVENDLQDLLAKGQTELQNLEDQRQEMLARRARIRAGMERDFENSQKSMQDDIDGLDKQIKKIEEFTNKYINSLKKKAASESYYVDQRKRNLSALSALASGDVFGFLSQRQEARGADIQRSYDLEIQKVEERRDAEVKALQKQIDKKQELMELEAEAHQQIMDDFDQQTKRKEKNLTQQYNDQKDSNIRMAGLIEELKNGQLATYDEILRAFDKTEADKYKKFQETLVKTRYAELQAKITSGDITVAAANTEMMALLKQITGYGQPGGLTQIKSVAEILAYLATKEGGGYTGLSDLTGFNTNKDPKITGGRPAPIEAVFSEPITASEVSITTSGDMTVDAANVYVNGKVDETGGATGGYVSGPGTGTSDSIPARLSNGEFVIKADSVKKYGVGMMHSINSGRFNMGGLVMSSSSPKYNIRGSMGYAAGGIASSAINSGKVYNITINGAGISDPNDLANIIMRKLQMEESRRDHGRNIG